MQWAQKCFEAIVGGLGREKGTLLPFAMASLSVVAFWLTGAVWTCGIPLAVYLWHSVDKILGANNDCKLREYDLRELELTKNKEIELKLATLEDRARRKAERGNEQRKSHG